ncbi:hypothetical protein ACHAAC_04545 [Aeromicrobium sp. CF4.19]|uniref:PspA-associated protein PspAB n=1 Tax=Aeromicrobium sp. CF4.19 TaxID=3373082 RepID=UPI003EE7F859
MGWFDAILGRTKPPQADLDVLFGLPQAAITLEAGGFPATGQGAVCFRDVDGNHDDAVVAGVREVISTDVSAGVELATDAHGYRWLSVTRPGADVSGLVTDLHAANSSLVDAGYGPSLLCSTVLFSTPSGGPAALVYLFKQGTFYPFVPLPGQRRDNAAELQLRGLAQGDVPIEPALERWLALWGAPGLDSAR